MNRRGAQRTLAELRAAVRRTLIFALLFAVCACGCSSPTSPSGSASPRTVYVSTTGSDRNDGTMSAPWQTLRYAVAQLRAGDTLYLRGGTYTGEANTIDAELGTVPSGTSWQNAITIAGYSSETATIQPPEWQHAIRLTAGAPGFLIFQDLIIDMVNATLSEGRGGPNGIYLSNGAHHNRFERLEVKNSQGNGIVFSNNNGNSPFNEVLNCSIHDNGRYPGVNQGYGAYVFTSDNLFEGNDIYNNGGYALHFYNNSGAMDVARNVIRNNRIHGNGTHGGTNYGVVVAWGAGNMIHDNLIYGNRGGIQVYTNSSSAEVFNNTIFGNAPLEGIIIQFATGTIVRDNAVYDNTINISDLGTGTVLR